MRENRVLVMLCVGALLLMLGGAAMGQAGGPSPGPAGGAAPPPPPPGDQGGGMPPPPPGDQPGGMMGGMGGMGPMGGMPPGMEMEKVKAAYLGVETMPVEPVLRNQLGLPEGMGLAVQFVDAEGPAKAAGIQQYDVLQKLDDQLLVNPPQLATLIRAHKPGDTVQLTVLRNAKPVTVSAKLTEKELPPLSAMAGPRGGAVGFGGGPGMFGRGGMGGRDMSFMPGSTFTFTDEQNVLEMTTRDGQPYLVAKDKAGKVLFEGPVATEEQLRRRAVPEPIRRKLEMLPMLVGGNRFRMGGMGGPPQGMRPGRRDGRDGGMPPGGPDGPGGPPPGGPQ